MRISRIPLLFAAAALALAGCANGTAPATSSPAADATTSSEPSAKTADAEGPLVIYSGRNEKLVGPLLTKLEKAIGRPVEIHYAGTPELAAKLIEEGAASPADVFFSQDAGALGALNKASLLAQLPENVTAGVPAAYVDADSRWVATSARARVLAYNPDISADAANITQIDQLLDPKYAGKIGYAPTNASFQTFVTALRVSKGEEAAKKWLESFLALQPKTYEKNTAILEAVDKGEIGVGLINHYYWYKLVAEKGDDKVKAKLAYLQPGDPGGLLNVAGAGVLASSKRQDAAAKAIAFLLSEPSQRYFADQTAEYSVLPDVSSQKFKLAPLAGTDKQPVDLNQLDSLKETQKLLQEVGMI